jgi:hypothetical protein
MGSIAIVRYRTNWEQGCRMVTGALRIWDGKAFEPDVVKAMTEAYEAVRSALDLHGCDDDSLNETVAKVILMIAASGETDANRIRDQAIAKLEPSPTKR